jgi:hypothetical protein
MAIHMDPRPNDYDEPSAPAPPVPVGEGAMRAALELIARTGCTNFWPPDKWACITDSARTPDAKYTADKWCDACIAHAALRPSPSAPAPAQERCPLHAPRTGTLPRFGIDGYDDTGNSDEAPECSCQCQPVSPAPESREALEVIWDALLAANRMSNVLYNLPMRYKVDGTLNLTGKDMDDLRRVRLEWEVAERAALGAIRPMRAALASPAARQEESNPEHRFGVRGFADSGDKCPACYHPPTPTEDA